LVLLGMITFIGRGGGSGFLALTTNFRTLITHFALPVTVVGLPATFVMGLTFPAASALIADPQGHVGSNAGLLLSANTLGAISGTFLVPFVVIPLVGSPVALGLIALVNLIMGIALAFGARIEARLPRLVTGGAGVIMAAVLVAVLADGGFVDPNIARLRTVGGSIVKSAEDDIASVQAGSLGGYAQLWVTGTSMAALTVDVKLMPILPLILRPSSAPNLTVAFGMGSVWR